MKNVGLLGGTIDICVFIYIYVHIYISIHLSVWGLTLGSKKHLNEDSGCLYIDTAKYILPGNLEPSGNHQHQITSPQFWRALRCMRV